MRDKDNLRGRIVSIATTRCGLGVFLAQYPGVGKHTPISDMDKNELASWHQFLDQWDALTEDEKTGYEMLYALEQA